MKNHVKIFVLTCILASPTLIFAAPSPAARVGVQIKKGNIEKCVRENASLTINYNAKEKTVSGAKDKFLNKMHEIEDIVKKLDVKTFESTNQNFNIYSQQGSYEDGESNITYQVSGSTSYKIEPPEAIEKISEILAANKIQFNVNLNSYTNPHACNEGDDYQNYDY